MPLVPFAGTIWLLTCSYLSGNSFFSIITITWLLTSCSVKFEKFSKFLILLRLQKRLPLLEFTYLSELCKAISFKPSTVVFSLHDPFNKKISAPQWCHAHGIARRVWLVSSKNASFMRLNSKNRVGLCVSVVSWSFRWSYAVRYSVLTAFASLKSLLCETCLPNVAPQGVRDLRKQNALLTPRNNFRKCGHKVLNATYSPQHKLVLSWYPQMPNKGNKHSFIA